MKTWVRVGLAVFLTLSCLACASKSMESHRDTFEKSADSHYAKIHDHSSLPDDYSRILSNPRIDRPVVVTPATQEAGSKSAANYIMNTQQAQSRYQNEMLKHKRGNLIQRLLAGSIFRQILPHEDPEDPTVPPDALILELRVFQQTDWSSHNYDDSSTLTLVLRDKLTEKSVTNKATFELTSGMFKRNVTRFLLDSVQLGTFEHKPCLPDDCMKQILPWYDSCLDKMLEKMATDYNR
jgi:hypothetical protein